MAQRDQLGPPPIIELPPGDGPHPAVVLGAEAFGINSFVRGVQRQLGQLGYATALPDYYHGAGPKNAEAYEDFTEVLEYLGALDFTCGARDLSHAIDVLQATPGVDPRRVCLLGFCTGATLAWLAAGCRRDLAAAVLFFPSQPVFTELTPKTPVSPIDLLWQLSCPVLFLYGDADPVMPAELLDEMLGRIQTWKVDAEVRLYPGAGHAFSVPSGPLRNEQVYKVAWSDAVSFLDAHT
jgi:carboxymethylenebutenolidase